MEIHARDQTHWSIHVAVGMTVVALGIAALPVGAHEGEEWNLSARIIEPSEGPVRIGHLCLIGDNQACGWSMTDFGSALAVNGNTAAIGHPQEKTVHLYEYDGTIWNHVATYTGTAGFGAALALEEDILIAGDPGTSELRVYERVGTTWTQTQTFTSTTSQCLGQSLDVYDQVIMVGDICASRIHILEKVQAEWQETATLAIPDVENLGTILAGGDGVIHARAERDEFYVFEKSGDEWSHTQISVEPTGQGFAADGLRFARLEGDAIRVYERDADGWTKSAEMRPHDASRFTTHELFGRSFDIRGDTLIVGAPRDDASAQEPATADDTADMCVSAVLKVCYPPRPGAAYIFEFNDGEWSQTAKLIGDPVGDHNFGDEVAIDPSETRLLVGAPFKLVGKISNQGDIDPEDSVFVFDHAHRGASS